MQHAYYPCANNPVLAHAPYLLTAQMLMLIWRDEIHPIKTATPSDP